jgi:AdoMet-dependent heme synthase
VLDEIRRFGEPLMVFTEGDLLKRPDLYDLVRYSLKIGLRTNVTPSATPLLITEAIDRFGPARSSRWASVGTGGRSAKSGPTRRRPITPRSRTPT